MTAKIKIILYTILVANLIWGGVAFAANLTGEFEKEPLFKEANFLPGDSVIRWAKITNTSGKSQTIAVQAMNYILPIPSDDLARALDFRISSGGIDLYGGSKGKKTLADFYNDGVVSLNTLSDGAGAQYDFEIYFPAEKGNEWQLKQTIFDIVIGLKNEGGGIDDPPTHTDKDNPGGGGGGSAGQCEITIYDATVQANPVSCDNAIIRWSTNCGSNSRIFYSANRPNGLPDQTKTNFGYEYSTEADKATVTQHTVTLSGLSKNTTYYYIVSSADETSREHSFTTASTCQKTTQPPLNEGEEGTNPNPMTLGNTGDRSGGIIAGTSTEATTDPISKITASLHDALGGFSYCDKTDELPWIILLILMGLCLYEENQYDKIKKVLEKMGKYNSII